MLGLFDKKQFDHLAGPLKPTELEGLDETNVHRFLHQIKLVWEFPDFPGDVLRGYDQNIVGHTLRLCEKRDQPNLDDPNVALNSFIISNTPYREVRWWEGGMRKPDLEKCHVLFQTDDRETYIRTLLSALVSSPS